MKRKLVVPFLVLMLLVGCATVNVRLSDKEVADWMLTIYNSQYDYYLTWFVKDAQGNLVVKPGTSEEQIKILQAKKKVFQEAWPLILQYAEYAKTGVAPKGVAIDAVERRAIELVNQMIQPK